MMQDDRHSRAVFRRFSYLTLALVVVVLLVSSQSQVISDWFCTPADPVRVTIRGIQYAIPAMLQPGFFRHESLISKRFDRKSGQDQYCQQSGAAPPEIFEFGVNSRDLRRLAAADPRLTLLAKVHQITVAGLPDKPTDRSDAALPIAKPDTSIIPSGVFSDPVRVSCERSKNPQYYSPCHLWFHLPGPISVRVWLGSPTTFPDPTWPELSRQLEALFITMTANKTPSR
jgi:hypothetical protein